eukprot:403373648
MGKNKGDKSKDTEQSHKQHRSKSDKLKKRHDAKKNRRKIKELRSLVKLQKKEKDNLRKLKLASESFSNKVSNEDLYIIKKIIGKLVNHNHQSIEELPQLFEMLDGGYEVDLSGLQDSYVMQKLNKVFKLMRLKRSEKNKLEFKKKQKLHDFKMKAMIQHYIDEIQNVQKVGHVGGENQSDQDQGSDDDNSDDSGSDSELDSGSDSGSDRKNHKKEHSKKRNKRSRSSSPESDKKKKSKKHNQYLEQKVTQKDDRLAQLSAKLNEMQYQKVEDLRGESDDDVGPKVPKEIQEKPGSEFLQATMGLIEQNKDSYQGPSKELEDELTRMFSGAANKRQKNSSNAQDHEIDPKKYLGVIDKKLNEDEELERQQAIRDYMDEYNSQFRTKSLLEQHQSKKFDKNAKDKRSKNEKLQDRMTKNFDREKDLKYGGLDSSKAFGIINKNQLDKRFGAGGSYL